MCPLNNCHISNFHMIGYCALNISNSFLLYRGLFPTQYYIGFDIHYACVPVGIHINELFVNQFIVKYGLDLGMDVLLHHHPLLNYFLVASSLFVSNILSMRELVHLL